MNMTSENPKDYPSMETWCAYIEGSLNADEHARLERLLQTSDRCFNDYVATKQLLSDAEQTDHAAPVELLRRATENRRVRTWPYVAAAVVVLATGTVIYRANMSSPPTVAGRLALLDTHLSEQGHTWEALDREATRNPFAPPSDILPPIHKTALELGVSLVDLRIALLYTRDAFEVEQQIQIIQAEIHNTLNIPATEQDLEAIEGLVRQSLAPEQHLFLELGQWLQVLDTTTKTAEALAQPMSDFTGTSLLQKALDRYIERLIEAQMSNALIDVLKNLRTQLDQGDVQEIKRLLQTVLNP